MVIYKVQYHEVGSICAQPRELPGQNIATGNTVTARHSGDPGVRVRVRVIITIIPRNGGPPERRTP